MMDKVRFGVIGAGNMGSGHAASLHGGHVEGAVLTAVCDIDPERLKTINEKYPDVKTFGSADEMYKSGLVDAVMIATPHYDHPPLAMAAFDYHIHALSEKPAGVYTRQVREMNEKAAKSGLSFGMMFNLRCYPLYKKMREIVAGGELGELKRTNWIVTNWYRTQAYYDSGGWRATWEGEGGGVLLNQCPHNLDMWQWICGMPNKITAFIHEGKWHDIEVEDDVTAYVEYPNGATGVFVTTTADAPGTNRFEITGNYGKLVSENDKLTFYKLKTPERELTYGAKTVWVSPEYETIEINVEGDSPSHRGVLRAFTANILRGEPMVADGSEGIKGLTISNAMHLSGWLGKTVELPLDEELFLSELNKKIEASKFKKTTGAFESGDIKAGFNR